MQKIFHKSKTCESCGNNPMPHWLLYVSQTVQFIGSSTSFKKYTSHGVKNSQNNIIKHAEIIFDRILEFLKIMSWSNKMSPTSDRSRVIINAGIKRKILIQQQFIFGKPTEIFRFKLSNSSKNWTTFYSLPSFDQNSSIRNIIDNKWQSKKLLESIHAQQPKSYIVRTENDLQLALDKLQFPVIIKPAVGSRGRHTHIQITTVETCINAFKDAKKICKYVLCEEMLHGNVYRFTTVGGSVAGVLRGEHPVVIGDGKSTIASLIKYKNKNRHQGVSLIQETSESQNLLARQGYNLESIPAKKARVLLGQKIGVKYGGDAVEVTSSIHKKYIKEIEKIASLIPLCTLGFDVILRDENSYTTPWGIIEINSIPFIDLHHFPRLGDPVDVADIIWQNLQKNN